MQGTVTVEGSRGMNLASSMEQSIHPKETK